MSSQGKRIFLSYSRQDQAAVQELFCRLEEAGLRPWMDQPPAGREPELRPGEDWQAATRRALNTADVALAIISKASSSRAGFVHKEFRLLLSRQAETAPGQIFLIPILLENCELPDYPIDTVAFSSLNAYPLWREGPERLIQSLRELNKQGMPRANAQNTFQSTRGKSAGRPGIYRNVVVALGLAALTLIALPALRQLMGTDPGDAEPVAGEPESRVARVEPRLEPDRPVTVPTGPESTPTTKPELNREPSVVTHRSQAVTLVLDSRAPLISVAVDGLPAEVLETGLTTLVINIPVGSHDFELSRRDGYRCRFQQSIEPSTTSVNPICHWEKEP